MQDSDNPYGGTFGGQMSGTVNFDGGPGGNGAVSGALIKDTTTAGFKTDVIDESANQPVLVDFWAPWCGPCKQLGPIIERVVQSAGGAVKLVKMNIDDHPAIPGQMGIQSIPAVVAFAGGKPVDAFMGAVPESQIRQFIDKLVKDHGGGSAEDDLKAAIEQANAALEAGDFNTAAQIFGAVLQQDPDNTASLAGMAECLIAAGQKDRARAMIDGLSDEQKGVPEIAALVARFTLEDEVASLGDPDALESRLASDPNDHQARFDMAKILNVRGDREKAADYLLHIMKADRQWQDDGARKQLLTFFEAWGPTDPVTLSARRRLSSMMFS
jgi:putative thioredoxin